MHRPVSVGSLSSLAVRTQRADELDGLENSHFLHGTRTQGRGVPVVGRICRM